jgi:type VI secretion system secreted protein Hcp
MAGDIFLKLEGIQGESTDSAHADEIELVSWGWDVNQPMGERSTGGSATTGKANHGDLIVTKYYDSSSPDLALKVCTGGTIPEAILTQRQADADGPIEAIKFSLNDVVISNVSNSGNGAETPLETVSLNYGRITWESNLTASGGGTSGTKTTRLAAKAPA